MQRFVGLSRESFRSVALCGQRLDRTETGSRSIVKPPRADVRIASRGVTMSTTITTPCRVPPPGDASSEIAGRRYDATLGQRNAEARTIGAKAVLDHLQGRLHFSPLCSLCGDTA